MQVTSEMQDLLDKYLDNRMTRDELHRFKSLLLDKKNYEVISNLIEEILAQQKYQEHSGLDKEVLFNELMQEVEKKKPIVHRVHFLKTAWFRYAAAILLLIGVGLWYKLSHLSSKDVAAGKDIAPGTNRAVLTIGNKTIDLATNKTGIAVGSVITYTDGEKITDAGQLSKLTTPRGCQYQAMLPDGSKVWLNAASSITFPSKFTGNNREVTITGEAYFEIVKNAKKPFVVKANKTTVEVLGTSFNISAYTDEEIEKTTLIDGSVRILSSGAASEKTHRGVLLRPGQQAVVTDTKLTTENTEVDEIIAWKNGFFVFNDVKIEPIMRQLARWYNLEVVYEGDIPNLFYATVPRNAPISQVLRALELTNAVTFEINNNKVTVRPHN